MATPTRPLRRVGNLLLFASLVTSLLASAPITTVQAEPLPPVGVIIRGHGNGHGRGLSQYGSLGWATKLGASWQDILNFYYDGANCFWNIGQGYGTAAASTATNLATGVTGTLTVANGGTGATTLTGYVKGSGTATMTAKETEAVTKGLSEAGKIFKKIASSTLKEIESDKELNLLINTYNNTKVRKNERITNTTAHVKGMIDWVNERYNKEADKRSSVKGKATIEAKRERVLTFYSSSNQKKLKLVFDLQNFIVDSKLIIINKLNKLNKISTFVKTKSGFKVTNPEGFVAIDRMEGGAVKLVNRLEFSTNNFSKDIIKGWDNPN